MKKSIYAIMAMTMLAAIFFVGGCSNDMSTSPNLSTDPSLAAKTSATDTKDLLIGFSGSRPDAALAAAGAVIKREYSELPIVFASVPVGAIQGLKNNPNVLYVEEAKYRTYCAQVLDWGVDRVDAEVVHATGQKGAGVNVCILDTGGDMDHPDLNWAGGTSVVNKDPNNWDDKNGHGTHCSGIVSANDNTVGVIGVAPDCNMYMVQVSATSLISTTDIIEGINWCIASHTDGITGNDIQIISMSFSGPAASAEEAALNAAFDHGILLLAAAGNAAGAVQYPAAYANVMAISASTSADLMATYSNYGTDIELIAPGSYIYSTYKNATYRTLSGTSMACPMTAGVAAIAWAAHPTYSRDQIRTLLHDTAEDIGLAAIYQGYGLADAENAALGTTNGDN